MFSGPVAQIPNAKLASDATARDMEIELECDSSAPKPVVYKSSDSDSYYISVLILQI